ncbi:MAG: S9 family peptidase [Pseudomonadota bacterium]
MQKLTLLCGLLCIALPALAKPFQNLDVFELEVASDVQISPDGDQVAYVRRSMDIMRDATRSNIWLINSDGSNHRPLLSGVTNFSSPRWSPDGTRLAYVTNAHRHGAELHVIWLDTLQRALLTQLPNSPSNIAWSPDGRSIAFTSLVTGKAPSLTKPPAAPKGAKWAPPVKVIDRLSYKADGAGFLQEGYRQVFVIPAEGGTPRKLTKGDFHHSGHLSWSPNNQQIIFAANRNADFDINLAGADIWSVNVSDGQLQLLADRPGTDSAPAFSPDGKTVAFLGLPDTKQAYRHNSVYLLNPSSGEIRRIEENIDRNITRLRWQNNHTLMIGYDNRGRTTLASLSLSGKATQLTDQIGGEHIGRPYTSGSFSVANNGSYAFNFGHTDRPADVGFGRARNKVSKLTDLNQDLLQQRKPATVEQLTWRSTDGLEIEGWLALPPGFDAAKKYPLLLEIHGGPHTAYGPQFSAEVQLYAAAGYVVLYTNPRGSTSYGIEFANLINRNYPGDDYHDLMTGVNAVIERGYIDAEQLFVTGGSGGGVLTTWIVGKTDRFRAAVAAKPVINWVSHVLSSDLTAFASQYWFDTPPWEDVEEYWRRSPLSLVGNVNTPTMLLTGEMDFRTPIGESEQYYHALKLRQVDTMLVRIPKASHSIFARPSQLIAKVDNILGWFGRYRDKPADGLLGEQDP